MAPSNHDDYDGYRKWLGITSKNRPPTHYELLAVPLDEDDTEVIRNAAEQKRLFVESKRGQGQDEVVNEILMRIGEAEVTLLNGEMRRDYDREMELFERRRKRRQVDPFAPVSRVKSRPGKTVGEDSGIVKTFASIMAIVCVAFGLMVWFSSGLPWSKSEKHGEPVIAQVPPPAPAQAAQAPAAVPVQVPAPVIVQPEPAKAEPVKIVEPVKPKVPPNPNAVGAVVFQGHSYKAFPNILSWHQAKNRCEEMGGHLPIIETDAENSFVVQLAKRVIVKPDRLDGVWLGATDERKEGEWAWINGDKLTFTKWGPGQPNNKENAEHYLLLFLLKSEWSDQPNDSKQHPAYFICEWDSADVVPMNGNPQTQTPDSQPNTDIPELSKSTFSKWRDYIQPSEKELEYRKIPWRTSFASALAEARSKDRPILLWNFHGHPLGCACPNGIHTKDVFENADIDGTLSSSSIHAGSLSSSTSRLAVERSSPSI